jgi:plastocyanin
MLGGTSAEDDNMRLIHYASMFHVLLLLGCQSVPPGTPTRTIRPIEIEEDTLTPIEIAVNAGDEVRWVNKRRRPVHVRLLDAVSDRGLSCKDHFGGWMASEDIAHLATNETASLCFGESGSMRYTVRIQRDSPQGDIDLQGTIHIDRATSHAVTPELVPRHSPVW